MDFIVLKHYPRNNEKKTRIIQRYLNIMKIIPIMDNIDEIILEELSKEKLELKNIGKKFRIPLSTLYHRIKKMEKNGIIKKYKAEINWKKIGYGVNVYVLIYVDTTQLKNLKKDQKSIKKQIDGFYFVEECHIITGDADLIAKIRAKTNEELGYLLTHYIHGIEGITKTKTLICID